MSVFIALVVVVVAQLVLSAAQTHGGLAFVVSVALGIITLFIIELKNRRR